MPEEAIITLGEQHAVMVIQNSATTTVRRQIVEIGARRKGETEIISGLREGQQIVTHGTLRLRNGAVVQVKAIEKQNESLTELLRQQAD